MIEHAFVGVLGAATRTLLSSAIFFPIQRQSHLLDHVNRLMVFVNQSELLDAHVSQAFNLDGRVMRICPRVSVTPG